jgi:hypothetical protein
MMRRVQRDNKEIGTDMTVATGEITEAVNSTVAEALGETWLTREELAHRWKLPPKTLAQWASQHKGPPFTKIGRWCRYRLSDVVTWENCQATGGEAEGAGPP